jgi:hypothetical protein
MQCLVFRAGDGDSYALSYVCIHLGGEINQHGDRNMIRLVFSADSPRHCCHPVARSLAVDDQQTHLYTTADYGTTV